MFTGLVQHMGRLLKRQDQPEGARLVVDTGDWDHHPQTGDSIAINGCCLTVVEHERTTLCFDVVQTKLALTTLGGLPLNTRVNLEHAATPSTLLGGHIVQGHIEATGQVVSNQAHPDRGWLLVLEAPDVVAGHLIEKGSISIDGVSLTIAGLKSNQVEIALIPETLKRTTLEALQAGDLVNLEGDCLAKMVAHLLARGQTPRG